MRNAERVARSSARRRSKTFSGKPQWYEFGLLLATEDSNIEWFNRLVRAVATEMAGSVVKSVY